MEGFELIAQGAEARLYKGSYLGKATVVKERFVKTYRHKDLDSLLTKERIKGEARAIVRAKAAGIVTPTLYLVDFNRRCVFMEYIENVQPLKCFIDSKISGKDNVQHLLNYVAKALGILVAKLHSKSIIHGDLTTSNILIKNDITDQVIAETINSDLIVDQFVMIDFGLAHIDSTPEDAAVDLYVLERSLHSVHSEIPALFTSALESYQKYNQSRKQHKEIMSRYEEVRARGRKRLMVG